MPIVEKHSPGSLCWFELGTGDQEAAKKFYGSLFAWDHSDFPMGPADSYTIFKVQGRDAAAAYTLRPDQRSQGVPPHWMLYIAVESADAASKRVAELGGKVMAAPFDLMGLGRMAVIQDPAGAVFAVWQAMQHAGTGITGESGTACWADLATPDQQGSGDFYSRLFGWQIVKGDEDPEHRYFHIKNGEEFIGGIPPANYRHSNAPPHWMIYFYVPNCDASATKAKELGANLYMPPQTMEKVGRMSIVADPQGAVFALFQPMPRQ